MILRDLLDIDQSRIQRSDDIKVSLEWSRMLTTPRKGFFSKLWGKLFNKPYILSNLLKFKATNTKSGNEYICFIELQPTDSYQKLLKTKVKVFCSCNDFKYRAAYVLNKEDNLFLIPATEKHLGIAITEAPRVITPTTLCKHLYAVVDYLKNNLSRISLNY